jgi:hypothetical protein
MARMTRKETINKIEELIDPDIYEGFSADVFERYLTFPPDGGFPLDEELLDSTTHNCMDLAFTSSGWETYDFMSILDIPTDSIGIMKKIIDNATKILEQIEDGICYLINDDGVLCVSQVKPMPNSQLKEILEHLQKHAKYDQERTALEEQKQREVEASQAIEDIIDQIGPERASEILKKGFKK